MGLQTKKIKYAGHWGEIELNEVCDKITDGTHHTPTYLPTGVAFISVKDINDEKVSFKKCKYISKEQHEELIKRCHPEKDDLLVTKSGTIGRMAIVPDSPEFSLFVSVALIKNRKHLIISNFLKFYLEHFFNSISIDQDIKGGLLKNFHLEDIRLTLVPIVSLPEQHRIVAKLEELFTNLDKGIETLKTAQQQLKIYRQSVLKWAFEGKLTNKDVKEGELPEGWKWVEIDEAAESLDNLRKPVNKVERSKRQGNIPYYGANGRTGWIDDYIFDEPLILVVEDETFTGREQPFSYKITGKSWVNNHAHILRSKAGTNIDFLNYQLFYYPFLPLTTGTTGRKKLTKGVLMKAKIKVCPFEEQNLIVAEIECRLSVCDKIEETISQSLQQAEALRQSILKKAFEGTLVPQDPTDEPASVLLERIRAERGAQMKIKPVKTKKVKKSKAERVPEVGEQLTLL